MPELAFIMLVMFVLPIGVYLVSRCYRHRQPVTIRIERKLVDSGKFMVWANRVPEPGAAVGVDSNGHQPIISNESFMVEWTVPSKPGRSAAVRAALPEEGLVKVRLAGCVWPMFGLYTNIIEVLAVDVRSKS